MNEMYAEWLVKRKAPAYMMLVKVLMVLVCVVAFFVAVSPLLGIFGILVLFAAAAAAYKLGLVESRINVNQPGGMIQIDMEEDETIYMTGTVGYIADISVAESFFS